MMSSEQRVTQDKAIQRRQGKGTWPVGLHDRTTKRIQHPCVQCGHKVSGQYQCGTCWGNMHLKCGKPVQIGTSNPRICKWCNFNNDPTSTTADIDIESAIHPPNHRYNASDSRAIRARSFPCPGCGLLADGRHQCVACFRHVHQLLLCSNSVPGEVEGSGMGRYCFSCTPQESTSGNDFGENRLSIHVSTPQDTVSNPHLAPGSASTVELQPPAVIFTNPPPAPCTSGTEVVQLTSNSYLFCNPPPEPQSTEERAGGWHMLPCPTAYDVHLDIVDRSQLHDYRLYVLLAYSSFPLLILSSYRLPRTSFRETHCILELAMQQLYPGWRQGSRKKYLGADGVLRIRHIQDLSIEDCVRIFYGYDQLIEPLWRQVQLLRLFCTGILCKWEGHVQAVKLRMGLI